MKLFNKLKNKQINFNDMIKKLAQEVVNSYTKETQLSFDQITELERQILATYLFGMFDGLRQNNNINITPNQMAINISDVLVSVFKYSQNQAESFVNEMITNLQSNNPRNTSYAIIHRGLEGYYTWNNSQDQVIKDIIEIVTLLKN